MCTRKKKEREINKSSICPNKSMLLFCQASTVGWGKGAPSQSSLWLGWFWTLWQLSLDPGYHWLPFFSRAWYLSTTDTLRPSLVYSSVLSFPICRRLIPIVLPVPCLVNCWCILRESLLINTGKFGAPGGDRWGQVGHLLQPPALSQSLSHYPCALRKSPVGKTAGGCRLTLRPAPLGVLIHPPAHRATKLH